MAGGGVNRDIAFDAVGNLYVVNNNIELLRVYSPVGANTSFTDSLVPLGAINVVPEPGSLLLVDSPFEAKETLKAIPEARWNGKHRAWAYPSSIQHLVMLKRALGDALRLDVTAQRLVNEARASKAAEQQARAVLSREPCPMPLARQLVTTYQSWTDTQGRASA